MKHKRRKVTVTRPSASERETQAVLRDHPEILMRVAAFEAGQAHLLSWGEVAARHGVTLKSWKAGDKADTVARKRLS